MTKAYYEDDSVTIYHGDSLDVLGFVEADDLISDPPYGFGAYPTDIAFDPDLLRQWVVDFRNVAVFGYPELLVGWCVSAQVKPTEWITWAPSTPRLSSGGKALPRRSESIAVFGPVRFGRRVMRPRSENGKRLWKAGRSGPSREVCREGDVWTDASFAAGRSGVHPNQKPVSVMEKLVLLCVDVDEVLVDPFMGSGTTLRAAKDLGRKAIGIELDEQYCEIAAKRMEQAALPLEAGGTP